MDGTSRSGVGSDLAWKRGPGQDFGSRICVFHRDRTTNNKRIPLNKNISELGSHWNKHFGLLTNRGPTKDHRKTRRHESDGGGQKRRLPVAHWHINARPTSQPRSRTLSGPDCGRHLACSRIKDNLVSGLWSTDPGNRLWSTWPTLVNRLWSTDSGQQLKG